MSGEAIAKVVRDIKTGRVLDPALSSARGTPSEHKLVNDMHEIHSGLIKMVTQFPCAVIDSTPMYEQIVNGPSIMLYDSFTLMPVWVNALIGYENNHGNVYIVQTYMMDEGDWEQNGKRTTWETPNPVDWDAVKYEYLAVLWGGGRSGGKHVETVGPIFRWDVAVYEDGSIADIRWSKLYDFPNQNEAQAEAVHQNAMLIWLQTYTLAGCTNVELVTPQRSKPERKRLARLDVNPQTIVIKKTSKTYRHHKDDTKDVVGGVPQRFVRGHYARYGPEYDRGLLFGKHAGKFWIPARAVGDSDREIDYIPEAG